MTEAVYQLEIVPRDKPFRCWSEPALLKQWFTLTLHDTHRRDRFALAQVASLWRAQTVSRGPARVLI
jgi:hypothetical protein